MQDVAALRKEAKLAYRERDFALAVDRYAQLLELDSKAPPDRLLPDRRAFAASLAALNRLEEAVAQWRIVIETAPDEPGSRQKLSGLLNRLERHDEAAEELKHAIRLEPRVAEHYWRLANEHRALGQDDEARDCVRRCLEVDPANTQARMIELEMAYFPAGRDEVTMAVEQDGVAMEDVGSLLKVRRPHKWTMVFVEAIGLFVVAVWLRSLLN